MHVSFNDHFGGLWGHHSPQMTSKVRYDLKFEIGDLAMSLEFQKASI